MKKRLQNILAHAGAASRRRAAELIESGKVTVDGKTVVEKGYRLEPEGHEIRLDGRLIGEEERKFYFLFNKPKDVISTVTDTHDRKKVTDFFKRVKARLYPVGRLDKDTTGLLVITNDGQLAHRLSHPRFEIDKEYLVMVEGKPLPEDIKKLERGIDLDGKKTAPCKIRTVKRADNYCIFKMTIHEGRKRQVRRMFAEAGFTVTDLKRIRYAGLRLGSLGPGQYRELTEKEIKRLKGLGGGTSPHSA